MAVLDPYDLVSGNRRTVCRLAGSPLPLQRDPSHGSWDHLRDTEMYWSRIAAAVGGIAKAE